ncbi:MAG TPA: polysaccharide ABC transporter ATP-binding protein [Pyrinomonadaceae bacterium]|nr:polysaccharide ABC transporter ATP-binding protein [Pyrinomonadaceae bacterium]
MSRIISIESVNKLYYLGAKHGGSLRESISQFARNPLGHLRANGNGRRQELWALKDVSFDVKQAEIVGLIGSNGAGKSTLLKILSRITEPTSGRITLHGRVGSLLEIGTGFHPELTGRENIFLNGAILGMKRQEIARKFDEIVAFSEIERFIDTAVKYYSSGMYVRLAFAVAAHLEPEILIVDEVLAVGDAAFQKKCLGKMGDVAGEGRTVIFVSHSMQAVNRLCTRAVCLSRGEVVADGLPPEVTEQYLQQLPKAESFARLAEIIQSLPPDPSFRLKDITLSQSGESSGRVVSGRPVEIAIHYDVLQHTTGMRVFFDLCDVDGSLIFRSFHDDNMDVVPTIPPGQYVSRAEIPGDLLGPIPYELRVHAGIHNVRMCTPGTGIRIPLAVEPTGRANGAYVDTFRGKLSLPIRWTTTRSAP